MTGDQQGLWEEQGGDAVHVRARAEKVRRPVSHKVVPINVDSREQEGNLKGLLPQPPPTPPSSHKSIRRLSLCHAHSKTPGANCTVGPYSI